MKKYFNRSGFTLIEVMTALLITVMLVVAMGTSMSAGMRIYKDATFESDSASMAGILNTALGDILRYSEDVKVNQGTASNPRQVSSTPTDSTSFGSRWHLCLPIWNTAYVMPISISPLYQAVRTKEFCR